MITIEQIKNEKVRLAKMETKLAHLQKVDELDKIIDGGDFAVSVMPVEGSYATTPIQISYALTDAEQAVLGKSIQVVLEFARQRLTKELEAQG